MRFWRELRRVANRLRINHRSPYLTHPQIWMPHLGDGLIVAKVGSQSATTAIAPQSGLQVLKFELHRPDKRWPEKVVTISILVH